MRRNASRRKGAGCKASVIVWSSLSVFVRFRPCVQEEGSEVNRIIILYSVSLYSTHTHLSHWIWGQLSLSLYSSVYCGSWMNISNSAEHELRIHERTADSSGTAQKVRHSSVCCSYEKITILSSLLFYPYRRVTATETPFIMLTVIRVKYSQ